MLAAIAAAHVAIASGRVDGHVVLGRTTQEVRAAFGGHGAIEEQYPVRVDYSFPGGLEVIFGDGVHASAYVVQERSLAAVERAVDHSGLRIERRYRCDARGCFGTAFTRNGRRRVIFGLNRGKPYLGEQVWPQP